MNRANTFGMRINTDEQQLLMIVAQRLARTGSDTVRFLIREKVRELSVLRELGQQGTVQGHFGNGRAVSLTRE
jgi:hypothetical protein